MSDEIELLTPKNNAKINSLRKNVRNYFKDNREALSTYNPQYLDGFSRGVDILKYIKNKVSDGKSKAILFSFSFPNLSSDMDFVIDIQCLTHPFHKKIVTHFLKNKVYNLFPNSEYQWKVYSRDKKYCSKTFHFSLLEERRFIYTPHCYNVRDFGGMVTNDNKIIRYGLVYRGGELTMAPFKSKVNRVDYGARHRRIYYQNDLPFFKELNIKVDVDLRGRGEANYATSCPVSTSDHPIQYLSCPICAYADLLQMNDDLKKKLQKIFDAFLKADKKPVYIHCWGGADRTGSIIFLFQALFGAKLNDLVSDYEATSFVKNLCRAKAYHPDIDPNYREHGFYSFCEALIHSSKENETLQMRVERYWEQEVGISPEKIQKLKEIFLVSNH